MGIIGLVFKCSLNALQFCPSFAALCRMRARIINFPYNSQPSAVAELNPRLYLLQHLGHHHDHESGMSP